MQNAQSLCASRVHDISNTEFVNNNKTQQSQETEWLRGEGAQWQSECKQVLMGKEFRRVAHSKVSSVAGQWQRAQSGSGRKGRARAAHSSQWQSKGSPPN